MKKKKIEKLNLNEKFGYAYINQINREIERKINEIIERLNEDCSK